MKYLVCVDGSENGDAAFNRAKEIYAAHRDEIVVLLVHSGDEEKREKEIEIVQSYSKQCLGHFNSKIIAEPVVTTVGEKIIQTAKEINADAIIIGRRGMSTMQRFFSGSVSKFVMENADCDVFVVKCKPKVSAN